MTFIKRIPGTNDYVPWQPPQIVALILTARQIGVPPYVLAGVPFSLYWANAINIVAACENEADAEAAKIQRR